MLVLELKMNMFVCEDQCTLSLFISRCSTISAVSVHQTSHILGWTI